MAESVIGGGKNILTEKGEEMVTENGMEAIPASEPEPTTKNESIVMASVDSLVSAEVLHEGMDTDAVEASERADEARDAMNDEEAIPACVTTENGTFKDNDTVEAGDNSPVKASVGNGEKNVGAIAEAQSSKDLNKENGHVKGQTCVVNLKEVAGDDDNALEEDHGEGDEVEAEETVEEEAAEEEVEEGGTQTDVDFLLNLVQGQAASAVADANEVIAQSEDLVIPQSKEIVVAPTEELVETTPKKKPVKKATKGKKNPAKVVKQQKRAPAKMKKEVIKEEPKEPAVPKETVVWVVENGVLKILSGPKKDSKDAPASEESPAAQTKGDSNDPDDVSFQCKVCSKEFTNKSSLRFHQRPQADGKMKCENRATFRCKVCFRRFPVKDLKTEDGEEVKPATKCELCINKPRMTNTRLRKSAGGNSETPSPKKRTEAKLDCPYCSRKFVRDGYLRTHVQMAHPVELAQDHMVSDEELPFQCQACGERFSSKPELRIHQCESIPRPSRKSKVETPESEEADEDPKTDSEANKDSFECETCLRKFKSKSGLTRHHCGLHEKRPEEFGAKKYERKAKKDQEGDEEAGMQTELFEDASPAKKKKTPRAKKEKGQPKRKRQKVEENLDPASPEQAPSDQDLAAGVEMNEDIQQIIMMNNSGEAEEEPVPNTYQTPKPTPKKNLESEEHRDKASYEKHKTVTPKRKKRNSGAGGDFECDICHMCCFSMSHLAYHKVTHSVPSTKFECHVCQESFIRRNLLNRHIAMEHV